MKSQDLGFLIGMLIMFIFSLLFFYFGAPRLIDAISKPATTTVNTGVEDLL